MAGDIKQIKPPVKLTVGSQYICLDTMDPDNQWTATFAAEVTKFPTVTTVAVTDNTDSHDSYASGAIYDSDTEVQTKDIAVTRLAFDDFILAKLKGATVSGGIIVEGKGTEVRPYFAYGIVIHRKGGILDMRWYPKCKVIENSDTTNTKGENYSDQTDTITIRAYRMSDADGIDVRINTSAEGFSGVTEDAFFAAPICTEAAAQALVTTTP